VAEKPQQYQLFVTNMSDVIAMLAWFYNQRAGAENLIKEAKDDAGMADHPSGRWAMNCIFSNSPCWRTTSTAG